MTDSSFLSGNTAEYGGGLANLSTVATLTLRGSASVTGNTVTVRGGGLYANYATIRACNGVGVDEWIGAISPNSPYDPPTPTLVTCA